MARLMHPAELVQVDTALKVLARVNLLDESNALAIDIGGNLAKLLYLAPRDAEPLAIERVARAPAAEVGNLGPSPSPLAVSVPSLAGTLHFFAFETRNITQLVRFVKQHWEPKERKTIRATGGGSYKYADLFRDDVGVNLVRIDEMQCTVAGLNFMLHYVDNEVYVYDAPQRTPPQVRPDARAHSDYDCRRFVPRTADPFPYLLVNIGSGVSIVKVVGHGKFERISGSALGGGTFWGLARLLLNCKTFDDVIDLTNRGNHRGVDMLVGDIYGGAYSALGLDAEVIAASFGKVTMCPDEHRPPQSSWVALKKALIRAVRATLALWLAVLLAVPLLGPLLRLCGVREPFGSNIANLALSPVFRPEDVAISLLRMVAYNIGQVAYLNAQTHGLDRIYFGGNFVRNHPHTIADVSYAVDFWSKGKTKAHFLKHDGYLGAIGAFINGESESPEKHVVPPQPREKRTKAAAAVPTKRNGPQSAASDGDAEPKTKVNVDKVVAADANRGDGGEANATSPATATANGAPSKSKKSRARKLRAREAAAAAANGTTPANGTAPAPTANGMTNWHSEANGNDFNKANGGDATHKMNGNGHALARVEYYDDDTQNEAVQELLAGEWQTVTKRSKRKT